MGLRPMLGRHGHARRRADRRLDHQEGAARRRRLRARGPQRRRPGQGVQRRARTWCSTSTTGRRSATGSALQPGRDRRARRGSGSSSSTSVPRRPDAPVGTLSGGNQQKVIVAREMSRPLKLFIAAQPTRGVDVGSIEFIHSRIIHERDVGTAVLVVSSELDEVVGLADRIAVMYRGRIIAIVGAGHPARGDRPADGRHHPGRGRPPRPATEADGRRRGRPPTPRPTGEDEASTEPGSGRGPRPSTRPDRSRTDRPPRLAHRRSRRHGPRSADAGAATLAGPAVPAQPLGGQHRHRDRAGMVLAMVIGAILIIVSDPDVLATYGYITARPGRRAQRQLGGGQRGVRATCSRARSSTRRR